MPAVGDHALWQGLDDFAKTLEPRLRKAFLKAVTELRATVTDAELAQAVSTGDPGPILARLNLNEFKLAIRSAVIDSADGAPIPALPVQVHFDLFNPAVARALQLSELTLVSSLQQEVREGIRQTITAGMRNGVAPAEIARGLRSVVGLTPKQVQSVANYRQLLTGGASGQPFKEALSRATRDGRYDRSILNAIEAKVALPEASVNAQVARFEQRLLAQRAETIARTESISASWAGQHLKWAQAIYEGKVQESELRRYWHVAKDDRVCPFCEPIPGLNEDGVAFNQPFQTVDGTVMGPAAHPNCRCVVFIRILYTV